MKKLAIFASGSGTNFEAIKEASIKGDLKLDIALLITDKDCFALKRAEKYGVPSIYVNPHDYASKETYEQFIISKLEEYKIDYIALAGYMRIVGPTLLKAYPDKIVNIHPSLLPAFKGKDAMKQAFDYGVKYFGISVHYVNEGIDCGTIIEQDILRYNGESLEEIEAKLHKIEHGLYPRVLKMWEEKK